MRARQSTWAAAALYVALTVVLAYPLSVTANRTLPADDPDGHLFMWTLAWDAHAFVRQPLSIFDANIFFPLRNTLALSENLIGSAIFAAPALWLTGNPVLAVNVVSLLSCVLCGLGAYVLGRRLGVSAAAAVLTGIIFAFSPPRFFRFSQLHLTAVQWIPFALASLHAYLDSGRPRDLRLAIAFFTLQVLTSGHGAVFAAVAILLLLAYRLALGEPVLLKRRLRDFGIAGGLLLAPAVLFLIPYMINQVGQGLRRSLEMTGTPIESFFASPTPVHVFLQSLVTDKNINGAAIAWLFPGFLPVLLALVAVGAGGAALVHGIVLRSRSWGPPSGGPIRLKPIRLKPDPTIVILSIAGLLWATLGIARPFLRAGDGLTAQSFANDRVGWTGYLGIDRPGQYDFGVSADSAAWLSIDNQVLINRGADRPDAPMTGGMVLTAGSHRILLEQVEAGERAAPGFTWAREEDGNRYQAVPSWALSRQPASPSAVTAVHALDRVRVTSAIIAALAGIWWICALLRGHRDTWVEWGAPYRRNPTALYLLLVVVCIALAIGGQQGLWQFVYWLPGFNFIRGSSRFMVPGLLGVAVLAGVGFDWLAARIAAAPRRLAAVVAAAILLAEFSAIPYRGVPYRLEIPAADLWLARQPKPFSVAEVPVTRSERYHSNYMLHSMAHWQKTVHGFSGILPALHETLYGELRSFPSEDSVRHLVALGVTHVVVHSSWFPPEERSLVEARLPSFSAWLTLEYMDEDSRVFSIHSPSKEES